MVNVIREADCVTEYASSCEDVTCNKENEPFIEYPGLKFTTKLTEEELKGTGASHCARYSPVSFSSPGTVRVLC